MSIPVPLGVRIYNSTSAIDRWVTDWVSDLSFRSVIPGGFASATIKLTRPRMIQTPEVVTGTATGAGTSTTPDYLVASDADAADISVGDRVWIYDSGGTVRFGGARFRVTNKASAFGFTNISFTPAASASTVSGDVMRAAKPGHFAYADPAMFDDITNLFNRVQIVDLRTMEIVWEGRVEDPQRDSTDDSWTIGCLGAMIVASDIQRPMFYADSGTDSWIVNEALAFSFGYSTDETNASIAISPEDGTYSGNVGDLLIWQRCEECDLYLGRFDITYSGSGVLASLGNFRTGIRVYDGGGTSPQDNVDLTAWSAATTRKGNPVGGASSFTSTVAQRIGVRLSMTAATAVERGQATGAIVQPTMQVQRVNRSGTKLQSSSDYPNEYVTVPQIVEDVVGRYLVKGWHTGFDNTPHAGQVRPSDIYIDSSAAAQITHMTYFDGATAADILTDLMLAQPDAYWAIWESNYKATNGAGGINDFGFRFSWETWPDGWGYQVSSADGLAEQPNGENVFNFVYYKWHTSIGSPLRFCQTFWTSTTLPEGSALAGAALTRALTVTREEATDGGTAFDAAADTLAGYQKTTNAGSVTVKRPIMFYDTGSTSNSGAGRMVDPWQIRPGKLARITDMAPRANGNNFNHGDTAPLVEQDGTIWKVVATEYNAADNACRLELDQVSTWATETQIASTAAPKSKLVVKG